MIKPIISVSSNIFDALFDFNVTFSWSGNQSYKNRLLILDNVTNNSVFDETIVSARLEHKIPLGTLQNEKTYTAQIQVFDSSNTASTISDKVFFKCIATPLFYFGNITEGQYIENSNYPFVVNYSQSGSEILKDYQFFLYDSAGVTIVSRGELIHSESALSTTSITYKLGGLDNNTMYKIECIGISNNGFQLSTGKVSFKTKYNKPSSFTVCQAECDRLRGYISYGTNIVLIQYNGDSIFEFNNNMVDLRNNLLDYDSGFDVSGDFQIELRIKEITSEPIFQIGNSVDAIVIMGIKYGVDNNRIRLMATSATDIYTLYSDVLSDNNFDNDLLIINITRKDNYYDISVKTE